MGIREGSLTDPREKPSRWTPGSGWAWRSRPAVPSHGEGLWEVCVAPPPPGPRPLVVHPGATVVSRASPGAEALLSSRGRAGTHPALWCPSATRTPFKE